MALSVGHLAPGRTVGKYIVDAFIGHGGTAEVYRVRHVHLGSLHALKVLLVGKSETVAARLVQEGRLQASLHHPNLVLVTDLIEVDGSPGLVMDFVDGPTLETWLARSTPTDAQIDEIAIGVLSGMAEAHAHGMVHRDLKPGNILLNRVGDHLHARVTDFGLAKVLSGGDVVRTRTGKAMGTPRYMSPEQIRNAKGADRRSDVFSLGALLYELATGREAFAGNDLGKLFANIKDAKYPPVAQVAPKLPARMANAISRALAPEADARPPDAGALLTIWASDTVEKLPPPPRPARSRPIAIAGATASGVLVLGLVAWHYAGSPPTTPAPTGTLEVRSIPDAAITVDGADAGSTAGFSRPVAAGHHRILLRTPDASMTLELDVPADQVASVCWSFPRGAYCTPEESAAAP